MSSISVVTSSALVSIPIPSKPPPATLMIETTMASEPSNSESLTVGKVNIASDDPTGIRTVNTPVKSEPSVAVPVYARVTVTSSAALIAAGVESVSEIVYAVVVEPSTTEPGPTSETRIVSGLLASSRIVPVPVSDGFEVVPPVVVTVTVKVSVISAIASSVIGVRNRIVVSPAAIIAAVAGTQAVPSKNSNSLMPIIPKSTVSPVAVTPIALMLKSISSNVGLESSTVNTANGSLPSVTITSVIMISGISSSMMSVVTSKSVPEIVSASSEPPVSVSIATVKFSNGSPKVSLIVGISKVADVEPAGIVTEATPL